MDTVKYQHKGNLMTKFVLFTTVANFSQ